MFNINLFYCTDVLKLQCWCFVYENNFIKNLKTYTYITRPDGKLLSDFQGSALFH